MSQPTTPPPKPLAEHVKNAVLLFEAKPPSSNSLLTVSSTVTPTGAPPPASKVSSSSSQASQPRYTEKLKEVEGHLKEEQVKNLILRREKQLLQTEVDSLKSLLTANGLAIPPSPISTFVFSNSFIPGATDTPSSEEHHRRRPSENDDKGAITKLIDGKRTTELENELASVKKELLQTEEKLSETNKQLADAKIQLSKGLDEKNVIFCLMNEKISKLEKAKKKIEELECKVAEHQKSIQNEGSKTATAVVEREELLSSITKLKTAIETLENENKLLKEQENVLLERVKVETTKRVELERQRDAEKLQQLNQDPETRQESTKSVSMAEPSNQPQNLEQILDQNNSVSGLKQEIKILKEELEAKSQLEHDIVIATHNFMQAVQKQKEVHDAEKQDLCNKLTEQNQEYTNLKSRYKTLMKQQSNVGDNAVQMEVVQAEITAEREKRRHKHSSRSGSESSVCSTEIGISSRSNSPSVDAAIAISFLVNELILSEEKFCKQLSVLWTDFLKPMSSFPDATCPTTECHNVSRALEPLISSNVHFKELLNAVVGKTASLSSAFTFLCDSFKVYRAYYTCYESVIVPLKEWSGVNTDFRKQLSDLEDKVGPTLPLPMDTTIPGKVFFKLLRLPLLRISEYMAFMEKIFRVDIQKPETLVQAYNSLKYFETEVNSKGMEIKGKRKVARIEQRLVSFQDPVVPSSKRSWVHDGFLQVASKPEKKPRDRWLFLFSDILLETKVLGKVKTGDCKYECKRCVILSTVDIKDNANSNEFTLISNEGSPDTTAFICTCNSPSDKELWLTALNSALQPKTGSL
ncbi:hypothetical protein Pelo_97 [Pelomyxa schiedti]|nr:hypothetical protein Pelo_97 [Pelomyxa schiedti]